MAPKTKTQTEETTMAPENAVEVAPVVEEKKSKKVEYPEVITFTLKHPEMAFDIDEESGKEIIDTQHKKLDENGEVVFRTRSFSKDVHGDNYVELAREFLKTNTDKPVITSHNFPL